MAADGGVPHFHNDIGVARVDVGSREFMCIGALPPFDHPHIFIDMGSDGDAICPYCSTHYRYRADLGLRAADPPSCLWDDRATAA